MIFFHSSSGPGNRVIIPAVNPLITGAAGFLGATLANQLLKNVEGLKRGIENAQKELKKRESRKYDGTRFPISESGFLFRENHL